MLDTRSNRWHLESKQISVKKICLKMNSCLQKIAAGSQSRHDQNQATTPSIFLLYNWHFSCTFNMDISETNCSITIKFYLIKSKRLIVGIITNDWISSYLLWLYSKVCVGPGWKHLWQVFLHHISRASWKHVRVMNTPLHPTFILENWGLPGYTLFSYICSKT